ncbi:MAG TPA: RnfABCDGE type electron transport complex subunit B [Steroidobacteraceae bacterium]
MNVADLTERIDSLLPQTQCTRCGYAACRPYAQAVAQGEAQINRCPPGGPDVIAALAALLGRSELPLDPTCGSAQPATVAFIDSSACIGCARCLPACPVDAILGAQHFLHTVLARECNGCELCLAACPVDCIAMQQRPPGQEAPDGSANRARVERHRERDARVARERELLLTERKRAAQLLPHQ